MRMGFEFLDAADLFLPYLRPGEFVKPEIGEGEDLTIVYYAALRYAVFSQQRAGELQRDMSWTTA